MFAFEFCSKEAAQEAMLYSYNQAMNGFSAKLTAEQVKALQGLFDQYSMFWLLHILKTLVPD